MARERIEELHGFHFVVEERYAHCVFCVFRREDVEHIAAHAKHSPAEFKVGALVLHLREPLDRVALR